MDYRIEKRDAFQVVCKRKSVGKPQSANATPDNTVMWQEFAVYPSADTTDPNYHCEIWVAVNEKDE